MANSIRILIADDNTLVYEGLQSILDTQSDFEIIGRAFDGQQAVLLGTDLKPDVILLDVVMPRMDGLEAVRRIQKTNSQAKILLWTSFADDERVFQAIKAGAMGYVLKDMPREQLFQALRDLAQGLFTMQPALASQIIQDMQRSSHLTMTEKPLTQSEGEILRLIAQGFHSADIADRIGTDMQSVIKAPRVILDKLHLADRTQSRLYVLGGDPSK